MNLEVDTVEVKNLTDSGNVTNGEENMSYSEAAETIEVDVRKNSTTGPADFSTIGLDVSKFDASIGAIEYLLLCV